MKFLKKQRIRNAEKAEDCSEIEEMELRLKMMKEHLTIHLIEIDRICPSALVLPYPADRLNELCDSIRRFGLLQPLTVRRVCKEASSLGGIFTLISGNGRLEALKKLGIRKAPCFIVNLPASSALSASAASLLHNEKRDVFEQAEILSAVSEEQCISNEELARRLSIDPKELKKRLGCTVFSHEEAKMMRNYAFPEELIFALSTVEPENARKRAVAECATCLRKLTESVGVVGQNRRGVFSDIRPFYNSVDRLVAQIRAAGFGASSHKAENPAEYIVTIRIPKLSQRYIADLQSASASADSPCKEAPSGRFSKESLEASVAKEGPCAGRTETKAPDALSAQ